ncbi:hypothetical protein JCM10450v2_002310 [Rhodotorula kratochvilovae]
MHLRRGPRHTQVGPDPLPPPPRSVPSLNDPQAILSPAFTATIRAAAATARAGQPDLLRQSIITRWERRMLEQKVVMRFAMLVQPGAKQSVLDNVRRAGQELANAPPMGVFRVPTEAQLFNTYVAPNDDVLRDLLAAHIANRPHTFAPPPGLGPPPVLRSSPSAPTLAAPLGRDEFPPAAATLGSNDRPSHVGYAPRPQHRRRDAQGREHALNAEEAAAQELHALARAHRRIGVRAAQRYRIDGEAFARGF